MRQHPMVRQYKKALVKAGYTDIANCLNLFDLQQRFRVGCAIVNFRIISAGCVNSWQSDQIPDGCNSKENIIMLPDVGVNLINKHQLSQDERDKLTKLLDIAKTVFVEI